MLWRFIMILFVGAVLEWKATQGTPAEVEKSKEKFRAYEFGYSVEMNQHRHEKKDENGIVMGEFGFITADGIYHVTVYATDENGKFKIVATRNYPYGNMERKVMIAVLPGLTKPITPPPIRKAIPADEKSCGGCVLTKKFAPEPADVTVQKPDSEAVFKPLSRQLGGSSLPTAGQLPNLGSVKPGGGVALLSPAKLPAPPLPSLPPLPPLPSLPSQAKPPLPVKPNAFASKPAQGGSGSFSNGKPNQLASLSPAKLPAPPLPLLPSLPPLPSQPKLSLPVKPNAFASKPSQSGLGSSSNGKPNQLSTFGIQTKPLGQTPQTRQPFTQNTPTQFGARPQSTTTVSHLQRNPPLVGGIFNTPFQNPQTGLATNKNNFSPQQINPQQKTFTPNTAINSLQNAKEPAAFRPLNKVFSNLESLGNSGFSKRPTQQINGLPVPLTSSKQFPKLGAITPQSIENTPFTQKTSQRLPTSVPPIPQFTNNNNRSPIQQQRPSNTLTPTSLQKTSGARTPTPSLPSTGQQTSLTPFSQSIGKSTPSKGTVAAGNSGGGPLYRFNYVLDYNSHREEGRIDGSKEGYYNTIDEDGIRRIIDYIANENGYQPRIKWERVPPNELPTGANKLKDYEFVWFN